MANVQVATYQVLIDETFRLRANSVKRFTFTMPSTKIFVREPLRRPVLWWNVWPRSDNAKYVVLINDVAADPNNIPADKIVTEHSTDTKVKRDIHEIIGFSKFIPADENTIDFRVVIGEAEFSDVVLFYQIQAQGID